MTETRLMRWLRIPTAFVAANWAGLLAVAALGIVPAAAGAQRVMTDLDAHADEAGAVVMRQLRRTWWRDLPVSLGMLAHLVLAVATVALLTGAMEGPARVFFVGLLVPVHWVVAAVAAAYVRAAATMTETASRADVLDTAIELALAHPVRALSSVLIVLLTAPAYVLAPLTVACGLTVPAWAAAQIWQRPAPVRAVGRAARPAGTSATP